MNAHNKRRMKLHKEGKGAEEDEGVVVAISSLSQSSSTHLRSVEMHPASHEDIKRVIGINLDRIQPLTNRPTNPLNNDVGFATRHSSRHPLRPIHSFGGIVSLRKTLWGPGGHLDVRIGGTRVVHNMVICTRTHTHTSNQK